jgi:hypothetical protein
VPREQTAGSSRHVISALAEICHFRQHVAALLLYAVVLVLAPEGRSLAREGGDVIRAATKWSPELAEFSMPTHDLSYGFYQLAKFNYFPGWHQQLQLVSY